jgi:hypothetical protein
LRNLLRKVYLAGGYDDLKEGQTEKDRIRKSRVPLANFAAALRVGTAGEGSGQVVEDEEVECLLANQIYKVRIATPAHLLNLLEAWPLRDSLTTHATPQVPVWLTHHRDS